MKRKKSFILMVLVIFLMILSNALVLAENNIVNEKTQENYINIFGPKNYIRFKSKPKIIRNEFSLANPNGKYYLRVYNGGNSGRKSNRVSSAVIKLNGKVIATSNRFNKNVEYFEIPVELQNDNIIKVKVRGKPKTFFTIKIVNKMNISIISPINESTMKNKLTDIKGYVNAVGEDLIVKLDMLGLTLEEKINNDGSFTFENIPVSSGENHLEVELFDGDRFLVSDKVTVYYYYPAEASAQVTVKNGGSARVDDSSSPIYGAAIDIPAEANKLSYITRINKAYAPHVPRLKYGRIAVGPFINFFPIGKKFIKPITLILPADLSLLPGEKNIKDVILIAESDSGWVKLPIKERSNKFIKAKVDNLAYTNFVPIIVKDLNEGELRIITAPSGASISIDGHNTSLKSPVTLTNIKPGAHTIKFYKQGYNETFKAITLLQDEGQEIDIELNRPHNPPVVNLDESLYDEMIVYDNILRIFGTVNFNGEPLTTGKAIISHNGQDSLTNVQSNGTFSDYVSLLPGENTIEVRVNGPDGNTGISRKIKVINNESSSSMRNLQYNNYRIDESSETITRRNKKLSKLPIKKPASSKPINNFNILDVENSN